MQGRLVAAGCMLMFGASIAHATIADPQAGRDPDAAPVQATPRIYQEKGVRSDVFGRLAALAAAAARQPRTNRARRVAMIENIRRNIAAAGSTIDRNETERVLGAIARIAREKFVPRAARDFAYLSTPLEIGHDQTISDSYIVAVMTAAVRPRPGQTVLDVGTGSGYQAAVLSLLAGSVVSIEIVPALAHEAATRLRHLGYRNVDVSAGDGFGGSPARAPFDAIIVAAGAVAIPPPLLDQLKPGGRLVMPIGPSTFEEQLVLVTKSTTGALTQCSLGAAAFVPFTGRAQVFQDRLNSPNSHLALCYGAPVT